MKLNYSKILFFLFFFVAGITHFFAPLVYMDMIPDYFPSKTIINSISGFLEIIISILILPRQTRKFAAVLAIVLLLAYIPAHIWFIRKEPCFNTYCIPVWVGWVRLLLIHPLLIWWAYRLGFKTNTRHVPRTSV
ncbi:hypothetical protein [Gangjinia marincola]|uniref:DoxX family protein n=1 Tax=Gangjinia marincola TaxID=578463 RepID=UPI0031D6D71D